MTQVLLSHQDDARRRLWDDHRLHCKTVGLPDPGEYQPMGDFSVKGDESHTHHHYTAPVPATTTTPGASTTNTTLIDRGRGRFANIVGAVLLGAGLPLLGAAGLALYNAYFDEPESVTNISPVADDEELRVGIHLDN